MKREPATGGAVNAVTDDLASEYERLAADRQPYIDRGVQCASLTIPSLFPPEGSAPGSILETPYQSIGARGVNNLANKLLLSILPPNTPFFRFNVDDQTVAELAQDEKARAAIEEKLNEIERTVQFAVETGGLRAPVIESLKQLLVVGNVLFIMKEDGTSRSYRLDKYVIRRDGSGTVIKIIVREEINPKALPDDVQELISNVELPSDETKRDEDVAIYTCYELVGQKYKTYQTIKGQKIPKSEGSYAKDKVPFVALRWNWEDNADYSRGYIEEYLGDLISAEGLAKAIIEASAAAAKVVVMVNPAGITREDDVVNAENLDVITGKDDDVTMLQLNKHADMQVAQAVLNDILQRLSHAFLMNTSVQRNAERVTAEEIRYMITELEDALGGTYALLAQEFQLPLVRIFLDMLTKQKRIPKLPTSKKGGPSVEPTITTGVEALGRGHDLSKIQIFMTQVVQPLGPEAFKYINIGDLLKRGGVSLGIDMDGLVKSQEQLQKEAQAAQQAQQQEMVQQTVADGAKAAVGPVVQAAVSNQES